MLPRSFSSPKALAVYFRLRQFDLGHDMQLSMLMLISVFCMCDKEFEISMYMSHIGHVYTIMQRSLCGMHIVALYSSCAAR